MVQWYEASSSQSNSRGFDSLCRTPPSSMESRRDSIDFKISILPMKMGDCDDIASMKHSRFPPEDLSGSGDGLADV